MRNGTPLTAYIEGIGLIGPGLSSWANSQIILKGQTAHLFDRTVIPAPNLLPPAERRRASPIVKLTLATSLEALDQAGQQGANLPSVFSFSNGDGANCHNICEVLASSDRQISPTRFHNSVHNAAAGYWSIATGTMATSSVLCAYDASFGAGLLDAITQVVVDDTRCILMTSDTDYPEPMRSKRPIPDHFGIALVLAPQRSEHAIAQINLCLCQGKPDTLDDQGLETLRKTLPSARGLPLLSCIAQQRWGQLILDYFPETQIGLEVLP